MEIKFKKLTLLICAALVLVTNAACLESADFFEFYTAFSPEGGDVLLMPSALRLSLSPGESGEITLITRPENLDVTWSCNNTRVCEITSASGGGCSITAVGEGACEIEITHPKSQTVARVKVSVVPEKTRISLSQRSLKLTCGESAILRAELTPPDENARIDWQISPPDGCAAISFGEDLCRIKGLRAGEFTVTAALPGGQTARAQVEIEATASSRGYRMIIALLVVGALGLIAAAWQLKRSCKDEKR